jgi:hypothetical protein
MPLPRPAVVYGIARPDTKRLVRNPHSPLPARRVGATRPLADPACPGPPPPRNSPIRQATVVGNRSIAILSHPQHTRRL